MPTRKKPRGDMTTEELIHAIFPKRVVNRVKRELEAPKRRPRKKERKKSGNR